MSLTLKNYLISFGTGVAMLGTNLPLAQAQQGVAATPITQQARSLPQIEQVGKVSTFTLDNGLQVVVIPDHRAPVVTQMIWYKVGSADEPKGHTGIAHFLEHLMFKGTTNFKEGVFSQFVSRVGGEENAFTSYDYTAYFQSVAPQHLPEIMRFEADRMENLVLNDQVVDSERKVILEERSMRVDNNPSAMLNEELRATLFMNHPYHNPVIGWKQEMEQLSRQDALDFYNTYYTPNNATLIIAGDVQVENVRALALETYGPVQRRAEVGERVRPQEPNKVTQRSVMLRDPRISQPSFSFSWVVPSYANGQDNDAAALDLLGEVLGGSFHSRLYQNLIVDRPIAAKAVAGYGGSALDDGTFVVYGMPQGDVSLEQIQSEVIAQINDVRLNGITQDELDRARHRFVKDMIFSSDNVTNLARIYGAVLSTGQPLDTIENWPELLQSVTVEDIKRVAELYIDPQKAVSASLLPLQQQVQNLEGETHEADQ